MKRVLIIAAVTASFAATPILANQSFLTALTASETAIEHSGGCRKSSPKGQCCHAGSKPYHCH